MCRGSSFFPSLSHSHFHSRSISIFISISSQVPHIISSFTLSSMINSPPSLHSFSTVSAHYISQCTSSTSLPCILLIPYISTLPTLYSSSQSLVSLIFHPPPSSPSFQSNPRCWRNKADGVRAPYARYLHCPDFSPDILIMRSLLSIHFSSITIDFIISIHLIWINYFHLINSI